MAQSSVSVPQGFQLDQQSQDSSSSNVPQGFALDDSSNTNDSSQDKPEGFADIDNQTQQQNQDALNIGDHAALSFLTSPQDQANYLQKKYPYVIPDNNSPGNFLVGKDMNSLTSVNPNGSGNTFMKWLASQSSNIPSMVGMTIGSAAGVPGAAAGAAAGEAVSKDIGAALGSSESPIKQGVDTALSGAFGAIGQKAAQMFGMVTGKLIAPKLAQAIDGRLSQIVNRGEDPSKFINFVSTAMHFTTGANKDDVATLMKYGVNKSLNDNTVNNPNAIINITQDVIKNIQQAKSDLGTAVGASGMKLIRKAGDENIQNAPIFDYVKQEMQAHPGWGNVDGNIITLNKNVANSNDSQKFGELLKSLGAQEVRTSYQAPKSSDILRMASDQAKNLGYDINNPTQQPLIEKTLGIKPGSISSELEKSATARQEFSVNGPKAFKIPTNGNLNVKQAIGTQQTFGQLTDREKSPLSDDMRRVFTNILYRDGNGNDSPLVSQLSNVASKNGIDEWVANKNSYKNLMQAIDGSSGVNQLGLDISSPKSIQDFGSKINKAMPVDKSILNNLENQVGSPVFDKLKQWSAIQSINNHDPNFLRLGAIAGLLGSAMGDGDLQTHVVRGMEFGTVAGIASPYLKSLPLRMIENSGNAGAGILKALTSNLPRQALVSGASQEGAALLKSIISKKQSKEKR